MQRVITFLFYYNFSLVRAKLCKIRVQTNRRYLQYVVLKIVPDIDGDRFVPIDGVAEKILVIRERGSPSHNADCSRLDSYGCLIRYSGLIRL